MERLPKEVLDEFLRGQHVMRHKPGIWNGLWSDMYIESTFMRYGHGPGGVIGITLQPSTLNRWALSLRICSRLTQDVIFMSEDSSSDILSHKEELSHRIQADKVDPEHIRQKMDSVINPLEPGQHHSSSALLNIVTGQVAPAEVNVDRAVSIGQTQQEEFETSWPKGFRASISKKVITMAAMKKHIKVGSTSVYDTNLIYSRVIGLQGSRDISMKDILQYELSPMPTSLFHDDVTMRIPSNKSSLKKALQVEHSVRTTASADAVIIDGCAVMWVIHWPTAWTVADYANNFLQYVCCLMNTNDVYLTFDWYRDESIKGQTRLSREGKGSTGQHHVLTETTPLPAQKVILTVTKYKAQLIHLVCTYIRNHHHRLPSDKKLLLTTDDPVPYEVTQNVIIKRCDMRITHEEADTIMVNHVVQLANAGTSSLKVISDDTDVFVLLIHFYQQCRLNCNLIMSGTSSTWAVIDIKATAAKHSNIAHQLLPAHALSGCDSVSQFYGIGKGTILKILPKRSLVKLGRLSTPVKEVFAEASMFMNACYGCQKSADMSDTRYRVWTTKMGNKKLTSAPALKILPPTNDAFEMHVLRAHFQAAVWLSALQEDPNLPSPTKYGWSLDENCHTLVPVTVPPDVSLAPLDVLQLIKCGCSSERACSTGRCGCNSAHIPCSIFCACHGLFKCYNNKTAEVDDSDDESE